MINTLYYRKVKGIFKTRKDSIMDELEILKKMRDDIRVDLHVTCDRLIKELELAPEGRSIDHADELWTEYRGLLEIEAAYDSAIQKIVEDNED